MLGTYHLSVLYDVMKELQTLQQSEKIYVSLLEHIARALDSDSASFFVADPDNETLKLKACVGPKKSMMELISEEVPLRFTEGLAGWCAKFNQPLLSENVQNEPRFNPRWDALTGYKTRSALCAPISSKDIVFGVIQVLNKRSSAFNRNDQDLVAAIAKQTAIALENTQLYSELRASRLFSEGIIENMTGGFVAMNNAELITHLNSQAEKILRVLSPDVIGRSAEQALRSYPQILEKLAETLKSRQKHSRQEMACERTDKIIFTLGYSTFPIQDKAGNVLGAAIIFQDLTAVSP